MLAAIDFGISNTDVVVQSDDGATTRHWKQAYAGEPDADMVRTLLAQGGVDVGRLRALAVTGGHHRGLPETIDGCAVVGVNEVDAIARGGQAVASLPQATTPVLVVSGGSGVAMIAADGDRFTHVTGSGVGGGAMLGLCKLLIDSADPLEIDALAQAGNANRVDLSLIDVVSGPIGSLPPDTTAVNFGRVVRLDEPPGRNDLAAAVVTLVSQVIGTIAVNAARAQGLEHVVVIGHLTDMVSIRTNIGHVGRFFGLPIQTPSPAGHATALGALRSLTR
jgi:type II pantothenate kinase